MGLKNLIPAHKELALQAEEGSAGTLIMTLKRPAHRMIFNPDYSLKGLMLKLKL